MDSPYTVKLEFFEGPLPTLLDLIERRKLFIGDVALSEVAEDFIVFVRELESQSQEGEKINQELFEIVSSFVAVASTLLLIKAKSLMPNISLTEEEESGISDLANRLKALEIVRLGGRHINRVFGRAPSFARDFRPLEIKHFSPDKNFSAVLAKEILQKLLAREKIFSSPPPQIKVRKTISLAEVVERLIERIKSSAQTLFRSFAGLLGGENQEEVRVHTIVSFLALLELVKVGQVDAEETETGDILIKSRTLLAGANDGEINLPN